MTARREHGPRLAVGDGQHVVVFGATGAGKTTTARRLIAARTLAQHAALLVLDQKGDEEDVEQMKRLAAAAEVPFILLDSQDPRTDRWQPLWGTPDAVAARCVEPVRQSEPYYYDALRLPPRHRLQGPARRRPLAALGPVSDRLLPAGALPVAAGDRRAASRRACAVEPTRGRARPLRAKPPRSQGSRWRREPPRGRARAGRTPARHPTRRQRRAGRRRVVDRGAAGAGGGDVAHPR